jgi:hypothetical protein
MALLVLDPINARGDAPSRDVAADKAIAGVIAEFDSACAASRQVGRYDSRRAGDRGERAPANTPRHTSAGGAIAVWDTSDELVCQVHDSGMITDPLAGHRLPPADVAGSQGLWRVSAL